MQTPDPKSTDDRVLRRDLTTLRRLTRERKAMEHDSIEWVEYERREAALSRKIRDWASR